MRKTKMCAVICVMLMAVLLLFPGCSKKKQTGIEGTWVLFEEYDKDGTRVSPDELKENGISVFPADEVILDGDLLTYEVGTVEDNNYMKMVFKRQ